MATVTSTHQVPSSLEETTPSVWLERFTASQRNELLHDDQFAGTSIALILSCIFVVGLLLAAAVVLLAE
jgi:hypothetical protein